MEKVPSCFEEIQNSSIKDNLINNSIHQLFEQQAKQTPNQIAIVFKNKKLTYKELNEKANQLANILVENYVESNKAVAIMLEKSVEFVISILAVLKAGGYYLPIDIEIPEKRVQYMLADSEAKIMITTKQLVQNFNYELNTIFTDDIDIWKQSKDNLDLEVQISDVAYLIYTSGTTGVPKGTMVEHKGIANLKVFWQETFGITSQDNVGFFASISFDASVWEIFMTLLNGATLFVLSREVINNFNKIQEYLVKNSITVITLPPSYATYLEPELLSSLRLLITAGSASSQELVNKWSKSVTYINAYGPTEASICATIWSAPSEKCNLKYIPIGKPILNTKTYILNERKERVEQGEIGELYIGGIGLARGYINRPELTTEKFIENPFIPGERLYSTGDLVRMLPDGNIEYRGRVDHQVKIRGHRVELGEIETVLYKNKEIFEVAVTAERTDDEVLNLSAYYVADQEIPISKLKKHLEGYLPKYMIPTFFIHLDKMPLTINGKIDYNKLIHQEHHHTNEDGYEAPRNRLEVILAKIWKEVLGIERVGIHNNFYELGGDSIKAIQVVAKLYENKLKLDVIELFMNPTIYKVTPFIHNIIQESDQGIVKGEVHLAPIQHWFFNKSFKDIHHWNQSIMLYNPDGYDKGILEKVFLKIVEHHDALRMVYKFKNDGVLQINRGLVDGILGFQSFDIPHNVDEELFIMKQVKKIQGNMDLEHGPLIQVGLFHTERGDHLFITIHHLVVDGISYRILLEDISTAYNQAKSNKEIVLPYKTDSFLTWTANLENYSYSDEIANEISYWKGIESRAKELTLFRKNVPIENRQRNKRVMNITFSKEHTRNLLRNVHRAYNTEVNEILLTALGLSFHYWANCKQVLLNLEAHGREEIFKHLNISRTVGWFTSQYPVLLEMDFVNDLSKQIKSIKEELRKIPNKGIGYEILKYLTSKNLHSDLSLRIEPEICFNYLGQLDMDMKSSTFKQSPYSNGNSLGPDGESNLSLENEIYFPIIITGYIEKGQLNMSFSFNEQQYSFKRIQLLVNHYKQQLIRIIEHCVLKEEIERTPSDFSYKNLEIEEMDNIFNLLEETLNKKK